MISQLSPLLAKAAVLLDPRDLLLRKGAWVRFSDGWPDPHGWAKGRVFVVANEPLVVPFQASFILPGNDSRDVDLSNAAGGLKLYPTTAGVLYQIAVGFKPGNYLVHIFIPRDRHIFALGESTMFPNVSDPILKYLGAKTPADSPFGSPLLFFYAIKDQPAIVLRLVVDAGVDFEKVTIGFQVNKLRLQEIPVPTAEQRERALLIQWPEEMTGF